jgi:hypothetical protein
VGCSSQLVSEGSDAGPGDAGASTTSGSSSTGSSSGAGSTGGAGTTGSSSGSTGGSSTGSFSGAAGTTGGSSGTTAVDGGLLWVIDGGQLAALDFGLVGDTRPPIYDDLANYPSQIIGTIFTDLANVSPPVAFVASTGDYMFALTTETTQAQLYVDAGSFFPGPVFPAMGNHECDLALDDGNCFGQNTTDGQFEAYLTIILPGFGLPSTNAYFMVVYASSDPTNPWTAKFIYTAPNAWDDGQGTWVADALAVPTTYTFFIRHEPTNNAGGAPGVAPTDTLLQTANFTLKLTGHSHSYDYDEANREVVNGLGGAALDTGYTGNYGYVICRQRPDNAIQCSQYDYDTNQVSTEPNSTFAILADGGSTPAN